MSIEDKEQANGDFGDFGYRHHNQMYRIADDYSPEANGSCDPRIYNCDFEPGAYPSCIYNLYDKMLIMMKGTNKCIVWRVTEM